MWYQRYYEKTIEDYLKTWQRICHLWIASLWKDIIDPKVSVELFRRIKRSFEAYDLLVID